MNDVVTLGLGGSMHDFSAALAVNGEIVVAIEDERITREKHGIDTKLFKRCATNWTEQGAEFLEYMRAKQGTAPSIDYCLSYAGLTLDDVTAIGHSLKPDWLPGCVRGRNLVRLNHHLSHAASAFYMAPNPVSHVIVVDGMGDRTPKSPEFESISIFRAEGSDLACIAKVNDANSLGHFYDAVTEFVGFGPFEEGKTMALAAYGGPGMFEQVKAHPDFCWESLGKLRIGNFSREQLLRREFMKQYLANLFGCVPSTFKERADVAYAAQRLLEESLLMIVREIVAQMPGERHLALAGGVGLNSVCNYKLLTDGRLDSLYLPPATGDNGLAIGNALLAARKYGVSLQRPRFWPTPYLGREYGDEEIRAALPLLAGHDEEVMVEQSSDLYRDVVGLLTEGNVVGWFQGRAEIGPRALGSRSIIADPRIAANKDHVNQNVKGREWFRPLAPAVLAEHCRDWFDINVDSPYMLMVAPIRREKVKQVPAVAHVDDTGRLQTVHRELQPRFYGLIQEFRRQTGVPLLLNTSFNVAGEPIVETPADAIRTFLKSNMDVLVLNNFILKKEHYKHSLEELRVPVSAR